MQHADKEDESCAQRGIRGGGCYCAPSPSSVQFTTLEPELLNGKQMEICCPQADAATTNSTASLLASFFLPDPIFVSVVSHSLSPPPRPSRFAPDTRRSL
jgi:hypothetical protein